MYSVHVINNRTGSIMFGPLFYTEYAVYIIDFKGESLVDWTKSYLQLFW